MCHGPYTVLVVEDEAWIRLGLAHHLEGCGFEVLEAASADQALALLKGPATIDLVFTDLQLPGESDGVGLARWVARNRPDVPVMLTSGELARVKGLQELCQTEGFISFSKPYAHGQVSSRIGDLIEKRRRRDAR